MTGREIVDFIRRYDLEDVELDDAVVRVTVYGKYMFNFEAGIIKWDEYVFEDGLDASRQVSHDLFEWLYDWDYSDEQIARAREMIDNGEPYEVIAEYLKPGEWARPEDSKIW